MMSTRSIGRRLRGLAPAVLMVAAACGPVRRGAGPPPAVLLFTNESLYQAEVYIAVPGVTSRRVGTVMPGRTDRIVVPVDLATRGGTLNIIARVIGRSPTQTGPVSIRPGEEYLVRLPLDARLLSFLPVTS